MLETSSSIFLSGLSITQVNFYLTTQCFTAHADTVHLIVTHIGGKWMLVYRKNLKRSQLWLSVLTTRAPFVLPIQGTGNEMLKTGLHVRRKDKPRAKRDNASARARKRSARLHLCLCRPGSHVAYTCAYAYAYACACVVRLKQTLARGYGRLPSGGSNVAKTVM